MSCSFDPARATTVLLGLAALATATLAQEDAAFVRGQGGLWEPEGSDAVTAEMTAVFGGAWSTFEFETADPDEIFVAERQFVYLEGGDEMADELEAFIDANRKLIEAWVSKGGRLFVNSAPNEGDGMTLPFGVELHFEDGGDGGDSGDGGKGPGDEAVAADPGSPALVSGPNELATLQYTGGSASHAFVTGKGLRPILRDAADATSLGYLKKGKGRAFFGGLTTSNFWDQVPDASNMRVNLIAHAAGRQIDPADASLQMKLGFPDKGDKVTDKLKLQVKSLVLSTASLDGVTFTLDIGGVLIDGTLDEKGKFEGGKGSVKVKVDVVPGSAGSLRASVANDIISLQLDNPFLRPVAVKFPSEIPIAVTIDGVEYHVDAPISYIGKTTGGTVKPRKP